VNVGEAGAASVSSVVNGARAFLVWSTMLAASAAAEDVDRARELAESARSAADEGRFDEAEADFRRAYELSADPELLFEAARAAEHADHDAAALDAYEEYLRVEPQSDRRSVVEARIAALRARGAGVGTPPEPERREDPSVAGWLLFGVSLLVAAGGVVLIGLAVADVDRVEEAERFTRWSELRDAYERSEPISIAGIVMASAGAVGAGIGLVWALVSQPDERVALRIGPGSLALRSSW
jgi:tetratricopeptide (TPR) repeat protein